MPGMEPSARQLAAARETLRPGVPQERPGGLFAPREERPLELFPAGVDANGRIAYTRLEDAMNELDGYKVAAEQLAACAAEVGAGA
jgi:hypothetical protein